MGGELVQGDPPVLDPAVVAEVGEAAAQIAGVLDAAVDEVVVLIADAPRHAIGGARYQQRHSEGGSGGDPDPPPGPRRDPLQARVEDAQQEQPGQRREDGAGEDDAGDVMAFGKPRRARVMDRREDIRLVADEHGDSRRGYRGERRRQQAAGSGEQGEGDQTHDHGGDGTPREGEVERRGQHR